MKLKTFITSVVFMTVFALSYFGVSYSRSSEKIAGEEITVSALTISSAVANCGEVYYPGTDPGVCGVGGGCVSSYNTPECSKSLNN